MFICNFKINGGLALKLIITILSLLMLGIFCFSVYKIFFTSGKFVVNDKIETKDITEISAENYTNILQAVHDNPDSYIGMKIKFTGYVYRLFDFNEDQFVIARDMFINEEKTQSVVVGFLSEYKDTKDFEDGTWVELVGTIEMGRYHNQEMPILKVKSLTKTEEPQDPYVNIPSNTYVPTSGML